MFGLGFFKHKKKCALCLRVISESEHKLDGKYYCPECYLKTFSIQQQRAEDPPSESPEVSTVAQTFVCVCCKQALPLKYRHSDAICVDCASKQPPSSSTVLCATKIHQGKHTIARYDHQELYIDHGALFFDGKLITIERAREIEQDYQAYQAYMDVQKGGRDYEEAYEGRGFVQEADGKWVLKAYRIDQYLHLISPPTASVDAQEILLYHEGDNREGENIILYIAEDGSAKIADSGWWQVSSSASNGGCVEYKLGRDYFSKNTLDDFIAYLTQTCNKDFSYLKNNEKLQKLFDTPAP